MTGITHARKAVFFQFRLFATAVALAAGCLFLAAAPAPRAQAQDGAYQPWSGSPEQQVRQLTKDLKALIAKAEAAHAADPNFIADLKKLAAQYETAAGGASTGGNNTDTPSTPRIVLRDDFSDGDYTRNPAWKVSAGFWQVDLSGGNVGLVSKIRQQQIDLNAVLGSLLTGQNAASQQSQFASIYTPARIGNAFSIRLRLTSKDRYGALNIGPYQGNSGQTLYRLVYQPGSQNGLVLQRTTEQGAVNIAQSGRPLTLEDGRAHDIAFTRNAAGKMQITVDGKDQIAATDTTLKGDFNGFLVVNAGGSYWIRSVEISSN